MKYIYHIIYKLNYVNKNNLVSQNFPEKCIISASTQEFCLLLNLANLKSTEFIGKY